MPDNTSKKPGKKTNAAPAAPTASSAQILLRNVPGEVLQLINRKKVEIMKKNPARTSVSHSEAVYKLILKGLSGTAA